MKAVFFDLDDTLYDRSRPFVQALEMLYPEAMPRASELNAACHRRAMERFYDSQCGKIAMRDFYIHQYQAGFSDCGITLSDEEALGFRARYAGFQKQIALSEKLRAVLELCRERAVWTGLITNGRSDHQREKIRTMGLDAMFPSELVFISGDLGIDKPDPEIFRMVERTVGLPPEELLYVGDSYVTDILPAARLGWHTLWLNRHGATVEESAAEWQVTDEAALSNLLRQIL